MTVFERTNLFEGMEEMLDKDQFNLFLRSIRMIFEFYQVKWEGG